MKKENITTINNMDADMQELLRSYIINQIAINKESYELYLDAEHKLFEQEDGVNALDKLTKMGANPNAYTSFNHTSYLFECTENFEEVLKALIHFVQNPYLDSRHLLYQHKMFLLIQLLSLLQTPLFLIFVHLLDFLEHCKLL